MEIVRDIIKGIAIGIAIISFAGIVVCSFLLIVYMFIR